MRSSWQALQPGIVSVLTPSSTGTDTVAVVRGNATGTGRVVARMQFFSTVLLDTADVHVP